MSTHVCRWWLCATLVFLVVIGAMGTLVKRFEEPAALATNLPMQAANRLMSTEKHEIDFRIWATFSPDERGFTVVVVSVNPAHFNRADMLDLAAQLDEKFSEKQKVKVGLLDDENIARLFASGRAELSTYYIAERGIYFLDREACREYVQFSTRRGKPRRTVQLPCKRPKH